MVQSAIFWGLLVGLGVAFWFVPRRVRLPLLGLASMGFLAVLDPRSGSILAAETLLYFFAAPHVRRADGSVRRGLVTLLIATALAPLLTFKYAPDLMQAKDYVVPLGISYFTFKLIHYVVDLARGSVPPASFGTLLSYLALFTTISAGPIERIDHYVGERTERFAVSDLAAGLERLAVGLVKKFVLAEILVAAVLDDYDPSKEVGLSLWLAAILQYASLYLDFSAYTDIAIGTSRIFGLKIMENFNFPFVATTIGEFWQRWHMTLAGWVQRYVYLPLLGVTRKPNLALFTAFTVLGLWHAGTLTRLCWGLYHAVGLYVHRQFARRFRTKARGPVRKACGWALTQLFVASSMTLLAQGEYADIRQVVGSWLRLFHVDIL